jgi:hypothetical protein
LVSISTFSLFILRIFYNIRKKNEEKSGSRADALKPPHFWPYRRSDLFSRYAASSLISLRKAFRASSRRSFFRLQLFFRPVACRSPGSSLWLCGYCGPSVDAVLQMLDVVGRLSGLRF